MRTVLILLCALGLFASEPFRIVAVERHGLPPYEDDQRIYRLQGPAGVVAGEFLELSRPGGRELPGRLRVVRRTSEGVLAVLDRRGDTFPLKGDVALHWEMGGLPALPPGAGVASAPMPAGPTAAIPRDPRRLSGVLYFLPGDATLSPLGRSKVEAWIMEYGEGRWTLEIPARKGAPAHLGMARAKGLKAVLERAGIKGVQIRTVPPAPGQGAESVLVKYQEGAFPKVGRSRKA